MNYYTIINCFICFFLIIFNLNNYTNYSRQKTKNPVLIFFIINTILLCLFNSLELSVLFFQALCLVTNYTCESIDGYIIKAKEILNFFGITFIVFFIFSVFEKINTKKILVGLVFVCFQIYILKQINENTTSYTPDFNEDYNSFIFILSIWLLINFKIFKGVQRKISINKIRKTKRLYTKNS